MTKAERFKELEKRMVEDESLPLREANLVFGEGNIDSPVLFIGEAPGQKEDELKRPFVGRSGQLLDKLIGVIGWKREDVFITNIVKRRPPLNRDPLPEEIEAYKPYLAEQIEILNPKIVATLGRFSMNYFIPTAKITRDQGKIFRMNGRFLIPLFHPAAALRSTGTLKLLTLSFKKLPKVLEKYEELVDIKHTEKEGEEVFCEMF